MDRDDFNSTVSWGAILAGGFTAAAVSLIVVAFGVGVACPLSLRGTAKGFPRQRPAGAQAYSSSSSP